MSAIQFDQAMIERRKRADNAYRAMDEVIANDKKILQKANFENSSFAKIEQLTKKKQFEERKKQMELTLNKRRQQLADLYNYESEKWREESLAKVETQEDRKARIMERAYKLRDAREAQKNATIKSKLDMQWRDACDDARTLDSKAMTIFMNKERLKQIEEKKLRNQQLSGQENAFVDEWTRQMDALAQRDAEKQAYRKRVDAETSEAIRQQMETNARLKEAHRQKMLQEELEDLERLREDIEREESLQRAKHDAAYSRGRAVLEFNDSYRLVKQEESNIEREQDSILLDYALRKEREKEAEEEAKRNANRNAAVQYRRYLEEQMIKEAEDTAFVDEIRKKEEEKVWKARDDALQARQDARDYLMKQVNEGRQMQIKDKHAYHTIESEEGRIFAAKFIQEAEEGKLKEQNEKEQRKQVAMNNQKLLNDQIAYIRYKEELEKQEAYLAEKQMKFIERQHQQRLAEQAGTVRGNYPLMKNNW